MDHIWYECQQPCAKMNCWYCDGGLGTCVVCGASEGELLEQCPGYRLTPEALELCYAGRIKTVAELERKHRA